MGEPSYSRPIFAEFNNVFYFIPENYDVEVVKNYLNVWIKMENKRLLSIQDVESFDIFPILNSVLEPHLNLNLQLEFKSCSFFNINLNEHSLSNIKLLSFDNVEIHNYLEFFLSLYFRRNKSLETLKIKHLKSQNLGYLRDVCFFPPENLTYLEIRNNDFGTIFEDLFSLKNTLKTLKLINCNITSTINLVLPDTLETLELDENPLNDFIELLKRINETRLNLKNISISQTTMSMEKKLEIINYIPQMSFIRNFKFIDSYELPQLINLFKNKIKAQKTTKSLLHILANNQYSHFNNPIKKLDNKLVAYLGEFVVVAPLIVDRQVYFDYESIQNQNKLNMSNFEINNEIIVIENSSNNNSNSNSNSNNNNNNNNNNQLEEEENYLKEEENYLKEEEEKKKNVMDEETRRHLKYAHHNLKDGYYDRDNQWTSSEEENNIQFLYDAITANSNSENEDELKSISNSENESNTNNSLSEEDEEEEESAKHSSIDEEKREEETD